MQQSAQKTGLIFPDGRAVTQGDVRSARAEAFGHANDAAGDRGTFMGNWFTSLRSADASWFNDRDKVVARARDASRNDVVGAAAGRRRVNRSVGEGWRLSSRISAAALGITKEAAADLRRQIDMQFRLYADSSAFTADAERTKTFGLLLQLAAWHMFHDGEALALVEWAGDEPYRFKTRLRMVDPDRLSNPNGDPDSALLRGGVAKDRQGRVIGYWIREGHPYDVYSDGSDMIWRYWPRFSTNLGRPMVLHAFEELRAGQSRGIPAFVSALKTLRGLNKYSTATLEAATINAMMVAFVKSSAGPDAVSESFGPDDYKTFMRQRAQRYADHPVTLDGAQIPVLAPDDEIMMQTAARDTGGYEGFSRSVLRQIASSLGTSYEELTMDFSQTNYSSARAALAISWGEVLVFRALVAAKLANPFFSAWLEEAVDNGAVKLPKGAPDFYAAQDAYTEHKWICPGKGTIDPLKEVNAAAKRIETGISTLEKECADLGEEWRDVLEQKAIEMKTRRELGLPDPNAPDPAPDAAAEAEDARQNDARPAENQR